MGPYLSFVIPFLDEQESLVELHRRVDEAAREAARDACGDAGAFEVIFVDDGSTDGSADRVREIMADHPEVALVELQGNFGKSAALAAGFDRARGEVVFTLDADLQDDPREIGRFLAELDKGFDLVTGYKKVRRDPSLRKVLPSRVFNWMVRRLTGLRLHDINCGFKAYRRSVIEHLRLYGELHRFTPALAHWKRFRVGEIVVEHHARAHGKSKFGGGRFYRGLVDLLTVFFLLKYDRRPAHFFGLLGGSTLLAGLGICTYLTVLWFLGEGIGRRPLLMLGVLLVVVGMQVLATGLIAELLVHQHQRDKPYVLKRTTGSSPTARQRSGESLDVIEGSGSPVARSGQRG